MIPETRVRQPTETVRYTRVRVTVLRGRDAGKVVESAGTTLRVGTVESADLRLNDDTVSREHCEIELNERGFRVRDLRSTNGLRAAGLRVYDIAASAPLEVAISDTTITIAPLAEAETRERTSIGSFGAARRVDQDARAVCDARARRADRSERADRRGDRHCPGAGRAVLRAIRSTCGATVSCGKTVAKRAK